MSPRDRALRLALAWVLAVTSFVVPSHAAATESLPEPTSEEPARRPGLYSGNANLGVVVGVTGAGYFQPRVFRSVEALLPDPPGPKKALEAQQLELGARGLLPKADGLAQELRVGLRYAWARGKAADGSTVSVHHASAYFGLTWQIHRAYRGLDRLHVRPQLYLPVEMDMEATQVYAGGSPYSANGISLAPGLGLRIYTLTPVVLDFSARYRVGIGDPLERGVFQPEFLHHPSGKKIRADATGFEPRISLEIHFHAKSLDP